MLLDTAVTPARALECCKSLLPGASDLPAWTLLAAFLMTHRGDIADASGQSGSSQRRVWAPYVAALPERTGEHNPMMICCYRVMWRCDSYCSFVS